jgi:hypothetical protein
VRWLLCLCCSLLVAAVGFERLPAETIFAELKNNMQKLTP